MMSTYRVRILDLASLGQIDEVKKLIEKGCDVNEQNDLGDCALIAAINRNDLPMVQLLINAGANIKIKDTFGRSALDFATKRSYKKICDLLELKIKS